MIINSQQIKYYVTQIPIIKTIKNYNVKEYFIPDFTAGLLIGIIVIGK